MHGINSEFALSAAQTGRSVPFEEAYDRLFANLRTLSQRCHTLDTVEPQIREAFKNFLGDMNYPLAAKNFDALLKEKSGSKFKREDGTVSWYHELIPLLGVMNILRKGSAKEGLDIAALEPYGGLEVLICTHLRHDSVEDHTNMKRFKTQLGEMRDQIRAENPRYNLDRADRQITQILSNVALMTQKKVREGNQVVKEDVCDYTYRMIASKHANPIVFMLKQADIIHNFSTFFGASKFSPEKRLKRCNEREDMYGPRYGFTDIAMGKWPKFKDAIRTLDSQMGFELYPHFRYLESVDLFYKKPHRAPVGITRFVKRALSVEYPDSKFSPIHEGVKRMMHSVDPSEEPQKYARLQDFFKMQFKPALNNHKSYFPYLFENAGNGRHAAPSPLP